MKPNTLSTLDLFNYLVKKTHRVPALPEDARAPDSSSIARQLDAALMKAGFKMSAKLMKHLSEQNSSIALNHAQNVIRAVSELIGDHVKHNAYFKDFPKNVPDTETFWAECIADALLNPETEGKVSVQVYSGFVNLLDLPKYGSYQHTYEDMLAAHEEFIPALDGKYTILHIGKTLHEEAQAMYLSLAQSNVPLHEHDLAALRQLAFICRGDNQPEAIPVRENKAVINAERFGYVPVLADTVTDVLRLACALSDGDVTLRTNTKFVSFMRRERRLLLEAIDNVINLDTNKQFDVMKHAEQWKRLGSYLHPEEHGFKGAKRVFDLAGGRAKVVSVSAMVEKAFNEGNIEKAIGLLSITPGALMRNTDRILRSEGLKECRKALFDAYDLVLPKVSGRVLLSLREHLYNRVENNLPDKRLFANSKGTAYVTDDQRDRVSGVVCMGIIDRLSAEIGRRLPKARLLVDREVLDVALPLSNKQTTSGFNVMPRGTKQPVKDGLLRFFCYWKETHDTTDYDLSAVFLDENFNLVKQVSYTNLTEGGAKHSGDITSAPKGASEFIDIDLSDVGYKYIVPQVNVYSGEDFKAVAESFFGFMERTEEQQGQPFEPATVKYKSDMRGNGRVALPLVFEKTDNGWVAKWMHLYLNGRVQFNATENNRLTTSLMTSVIAKREYITIGDIVELGIDSGKFKVVYESPYVPESADERVIYLGLNVPEGLAEATETITLINLYDIIPA